MNAAVDAYRARLDQLGADATAEPIGWVCRTCGGRMTAPDSPADADTLARMMDLLAEAAEQHAGSGCAR